MTASLRYSLAVLVLALCPLASTAEAEIRNQNTGVTYATIQLAVNAASPGHVILVDAGTYAESVTITKSLTIQRNGAGTVIIDPPPANFPNGININNASVVLRDLQLSGAGGNGIAAFATAGSGHALTLERVDCVSNNSTGLVVTNFLVVTVSQGTYSNNSGAGASFTGIGTVDWTSATASGPSFGLTATNTSNALNISTSTLTGNTALRAINDTRAGGLNLNRVALSGTGTSVTSGFTAVTVSVTGIDDITNDSVTVSPTQFTTTRNGTANQVATYENHGSVTFNLYGGNDTATISGTGSPVTISAGDGTDTITVANGSNSLDDLAATLTVAGGNGTDAMTVNDSGETSATTYMITTTTVGRFGVSGVGYNNTIELITLSTSGQNDQVSVLGTSTRFDVNLNAGNDTLTFSANGANLSGGNVVGGAGHDSLDYGGYTSPIAASLSNDLLLQGTLQQGQTVPPSGSTGTGGVVMVYTTLGARFDMRIGVNNIAASAVTGDHIHGAASGVNGPLAVDLSAAGAWQTVGSSIVKVLTNVGFPSAHVSALAAGNTYVDVHTAAHPTGSVRAQLSITVPANWATGTGSASGFENVHGGSGNDLILGSGGDDVLAGRGGNDLIFGRGGNDLIVGNAGDDLLFGDAGDDHFSWTPGEGSDIVEGGAGTDRFVFSGSDTENDAIVARMNGNRVLVGRTNLTPATHDLSGIDVMDLHGRGGDDFYNVEPLTGVSFGAFGGSGNDTLVYDALCAAVGVSSSNITHPTRSHVSYQAETLTFANRTTITPATPSYASAGGNGVLSLTTGASCAWTAAASMPFIQITAGGSGTGNGSVSYRVTPNVLTIPRSGVITVAGGTATIQQTAAGMSPNSPFDLNGDGGGDLLLHHSGDGSIAAWFMNERVLIDGSLLDPGQVSDLQWQVVGMGDFNSDGKIDILWQRTDDGRLAVWLMNGTTRLDVLPLSPDRMPDPSWRVRAVGDMNGDGKPDLIIQNTVSGHVGVWFMNGLVQTDGRLFDPDRTSPDWTIVGAADLNADGKRDVVFQHNDGTLAVWFMDGATRLDAVLFSPSAMSDPTWRIKGIMDVNVDGHPDLLMQHPDGRMAAFLLNGTTLVDGLLFVPAQTMDPAWRLVGPR